MEYLNMVKQTFDTPYYYFSYTYDLTHSMQRLYNTSTSLLNVRIYFILVKLMKIVFDQTSIIINIL